MSRVAVALGLATRRDDLVEDRLGAVELARIRQAFGLAAETIEGQGWSGPSFDVSSVSVSLEELQRPVVLTGRRHSSWRGCSCSRACGVVGAELRLPAMPPSPPRASAPVGLAGDGIAAGEVAHAQERVGVVGAELRLLSARVSSRSLSARSCWPASA